ncbi:TlyA family rRNA (cytidine-2'-O)-methyltransferase [Dictyobacter alpinus]|uniref:TlyA family rRNA (Cytidine-2'-O)-methyltransferase n=1 Tax=Dictyobacter alpinus TaxID=2014873 RepID=A0A402B674_9CHLR|nr:TlyA family RNA methyltransferase [Dictyobacter alpinus]GCE26827.1 TlyA family rRNA (cytidine-2'-O)-methyltransferase [Dictyobacter alpinus]
MAAKKERLDAALVRQGVAPGIERARAMIMAGQVYVGDRLVDKPGTLVPLDAYCHVAATSPEDKYVSRGGLKLEKALDSFQLDPAHAVAIDVGSSTGGFTECLLDHGATRVYAIDVGHGQLAWKLRNDPRVVVMERTNIRHLTSLPEPMQCAVIDVSFISLRPVLPHLIPLLAQSPDTWIVALVKPQFEADKLEVDRGSGVIKDPEVHQRILQELRVWITEQTPLQVDGEISSPILGRDGNREFLFLLRFKPSFLRTTLPS